MPFWLFGGLKGVVSDRVWELVYLDFAFFLIALISFLFVQFT